VEAVGVFEGFRPKLDLGAVDILLIPSGLLVALVVAGWSCARSYFEKGRVRGGEEATRDILRGMSLHYELEGRTVPENVVKALKAVHAASRNRRRRRGSAPDPYQVHLSNLGYAVGEACWLKGHGSGVRRKAPAEGKIRLDLSLNELLQLSWLAHHGFQHMMPNYRSFEIFRFSDEEEAEEGAKAVSKIECAIPAKDRPFADPTVQFKKRQKLISDWWQPRRLTA
jgi:hypothetical protein